MLPTTLPWKQQGPYIWYQKRLGAIVWTWVYRLRQWAAHTGPALGSHFKLPSQTSLGAFWTHDSEEGHTTEGESEMLLQTHF